MPKRSLRKTDPPQPPPHKTAKKPAVKPRTKKVPRSATKKSRTDRKGPASLGRVKVSADARLDLLFQKDYQAREIFDFLKVQTLRELEQHRPTKSSSG